MTEKENGPGALAGATEAGNVTSAHGLAQSTYSGKSAGLQRVGDVIRQKPPATDLRSRRGWSLLRRLHDAVAAYVFRLIQSMT